MIYIEKRIHHVWLEWCNLPDSYKKSLPKGFNQSIIGKYQYIASNEKGHEISIVELPNHLRDGVTLWEIYCLEGELFDDIERYDSLDEAIEQSKKYLGKE